MGATGTKPSQLAPKEIGGCSAPRWSGLGLVGKHSRTEHGQLTRRSSCLPPSPCGTINLGSAGRGFGEGQGWRTTLALRDGHTRPQSCAVGAESVKGRHGVGSAASRTSASSGEGTGTHGRALEGDASPSLSARRTREGRRSPPNGLERVAIGLVTNLSLADGARPYHRPAIAGAASSKRTLNS